MNLMVNELLPNLEIYLYRYKDRRKEKINSITNAWGPKKKSKRGRKAKSNFNFALKKEAKV